MKRDGEGSGEGERRTQSESQSRTFVSLRGGERRRKPSVQGRERALALGGLLGEQKAGSKAMEAQMEGNFCPLKNDFLILFFGFLFSVYGWSGRGALAHGPGDVPGGSLPASALQAARAAKRRCVRVNFGTDSSQRTTCTQGRRCLTGAFPFSPVTCTHTTQKGEGSALGTGCCCNNLSPLSLGGGGVAPLGAVTEKPPACPLLGQISPKVHPQVPCRGGQRAREHPLLMTRAEDTQRRAKKKECENESPVKSSSASIHRDTQRRILTREIIAGSLAQT